MIKFDTEKKIAFAIVIIFSFILFVAFSPIGRGAWNLWMGAVQKVDDSTSYRTRKEVEDTCRAMISSYEADRLTYEQYHGNDSSEKRSWAEEAKMRANKTATIYNNFILENSFVWAGNVPADIKSELLYLE